MSRLDDLRALMLTQRQQQQSPSAPTGSTRPYTTQEIDAEVARLRNIGKEEGWWNLHTPPGSR